ncbi:hypothetical protein F4782DRAFT_549560 [Xylaria castorea]|nr:hypothetical protein F4782DRAFT_549560 [Xylaria castorea]
MSSSDDSEFAGPRPGVKQIKDASKAFVRLYKAQASTKLAESRPPITKKDLRALTRDLKPSVDDRIVGSSYWTEHMLEKVESRYIDKNSVINNRDKYKPDGGLMLYRACLRVWRKLPTQIITPANGLVFMGKGDGNFLNRPMKLRLKWSAIFNERLTSLLIHPAWSGKLHYLLTALAIASMCESDDRRYWGVVYVGKDPFFDTWELCQTDRPEKPKNAILDDVEESLRARGFWPCTICQVLQAIASRARLGQASDDDDEEEGGGGEEESDDGNSTQQKSLRALSANHLLRIQSALDNMTNDMGMPTFHKTKDYYHLFSASRDGGTYKSSDYPTSEGYQELLKQARIGLVYDAYAYRIAWEKEKVVLGYVQKDVTRSSVNTTRQSPSEQSREALNEYRGRPSQRRSGDIVDSNTAIGQRKRPRDILADKDTSERPKRAARHLHPAFTLRDASSISTNEGAGSFSQRPLSRTSIKREEQINTPTPAMASTNMMISIPTPASYTRSRLDSHRIGHRRETTGYDNVHPSRAVLMRQSDPEPRGMDEFIRRDPRSFDYPHPNGVKREMNCSN